MTVAFDINDLLVIILMIAAIVLIIYAIIMVSNLIKTLKKVNVVLDDTKVVTEVAAKKSKQVDSLMDEAGLVALDVMGAVRGNASTISKLRSVGQGAASMKSLVDKFKKDEACDGYVKRTKVKK